MFNSIFVNRLSKLSRRLTTGERMTLFLRNMLRQYAIAVVVIIAGMTPTALAQQRYDYKVLATNKTSTMQKEMTAAAAAGYRLEKVMGGNTAFGGSEVVVIM